MKLLPSHCTAPLNRLVRRPLTQVHTYSGPPPPRSGPHRLAAALPLACIPQHLFGPPPPSAGFRFWLDESLWSRGREAVQLIEAVLIEAGGSRTGGPPRGRGSRYSQGGVRGDACNRRYNSLHCAGGRRRTGQRGNGLLYVSASILQVRQPRLRPPRPMGVTLEQEHLRTACRPRPSPWPGHQRSGGVELPDDETAHAADAQGEGGGGALPVFGLNCLTMKRRMQQTLKVRGWGGGGSTPCLPAPPRSAGCQHGGGGEGTPSRPAHTSPSPLPPPAVTELAPEPSPPSPRLPLL